MIRNMSVMKIVHLPWLLFAAFFYDLPITHSVLHVTQSNVAAQDQDGRYFLELRCGNFTFPNQPSFAVEWLVPSGRTVTATGYQDGHFTLWLSAPVEGGNYICRIPKDSCDQDCLQDSGIVREATLSVNALEARMVLAEARQERIQWDHEVIVEQHRQLNQLYARLKSRALDLGKQTRVSLASFGSRLAVVEPVVVLNNKTGHHISFHATSLQNNTTPHSGHITLKPSSVWTNQGGAYNASTGFFMTPFPGIYFFAVTTGCLSPNRNADFVLAVEGIVIAYSTTRNLGNVKGQVATAHGIVHLKRAQKVFLRAMSHDVDFFSEATTFSGFLLYPDPPNSTANFPWPG